MAISRRRFVQGAAGALVLPPVRFAAGDATRVITGHLPPGAPDFVYLPVRMPAGVRELAVAYSYDQPGNALDIGIFDQRGIALGGPGFRGWSGGFRTSFEISRSAATPGYLPGPVTPGLWHVVLGPYQVAPQGMDYRVEVTLRYGPPGPAYVPAYPPRRARGRGPAWYRGDCHLHTVYSDGRREPAEVAAGARAAGLDFIVSTEHNTPAAHGVWGAYAGPDLLILTGEEITTRNGHYLAVGLPPGEWVDWRYRARDGDFRRFARQVHAAGALLVPAHPYCPFVGCAWKFGYGAADAVEVWNGPWTADDESAVDTWDALLGASEPGHWLPAMGDSDAHHPGQVIGLPQTVVYADALERDAILRGLRAGRSWLAESSAVDVQFLAVGGGRTAGIGERLQLSAAAPVDVVVSVRGVPGGTVRLITDEGQLHTEPLPVTGAGTVTWRTTPSLAAYVRAEVRQPGPGTTGRPFGPMAAMTNPIFLGER
jgi:hypothetical protein